MIVNMKPAGMGSYVAPNNQGPNSINQDPISLSGFTVRELSQEELFVELNSYQSVCGHTPWLIGGQSLSSWPELPDHLKINISSSYESFDALMG